MALDQATIAAIAQQLLDAERTATPIGQLSVEHPGMDPADAYAIQQSVVAARIAAGERKFGAGRWASPARSCSRCWACRSPITPPCSAGGCWRTARPSPGQTSSRRAWKRSKSGSCCVPRCAARA